VTEAADGTVSLHFYSLLMHRVSAVVVLSPEDAKQLAVDIVETLQTMQAAVQSDEPPPNEPPP
jgi:hypothetical protein